MNALRLQYFVGIAVLGAMGPYLSVYLRERNMSEAQVGWVQSMTGIGVLLAPVVMALIADVKVSNRRLLAGVFVCCGLATALMANVSSFTLLAIAFALSSMSLAPLRSLLDGLTFSEQEKRELNGQTRIPYHRIRVFGTLGFMAPAFVLYLLLRDGRLPTTVAIVMATCLCGIAVVNTFALPDTVRPASTGPRRLPTLGALRAMLEPHLFVYVFSMWLFQAAVFGVAAFYPIYLNEKLNVGVQWLGLIQCIAVTVEVGCVLSFGWLMRRLGLKGLLMIAMTGGALRYTLLWMFPVVWVAVGVQLMGGLMALINQVAAPVYLNQRVDPAYRNSIQGTYVMIVEGFGRMVGTAAAGYLAGYNITQVFGIAAVTCAACVVLFGFAFHDAHAHKVQP